MKKVDLRDIWKDVKWVGMMVSRLGEMLGGKKVLWKVLRKVGQSVDR